ncbi:hypothetical protein C9412_13105 [Stenotrophomonas sp. Nf1]|nr:hypothetical protein C9412_13105 [Stenotrophomonas sp. Nf1]PTA81872.1 hypothetical protein C9416_06960 [Stenotrophomonas sp. Nf4]
MAATGAVAAVLGLSGSAAGMAMMSAEEMREPVFRVEFELGDLPVKGLLWNWPFKEGDVVRVVGARDPEGVFIAVSVLDECRRLIVSYPHICAGSRAHWISVSRYTLLISLPICTLSTVGIGLNSLGILEDGWMLLKLLLCIFGGLLLVSATVGIRVGYRFHRFARLADAIFGSLGWDDGKGVNLRRITRMKKSPNDPAALGDTYFRY